MYHLYYSWPNPHSTSNLFLIGLHLQLMIQQRLRRILFGYFPLKNSPLTIKSKILSSKSFIFDNLFSYSILSDFKLGKFSIFQSRSISFTKLEDFVMLPLAPSLSAFNFFKSSSAIIFNVKPPIHLATI